MSLQAGTNQHKQAARSGKLEHLQYKRNYLLLVRRQSIHSNYIQMSAAAAAAANVMTAESNNKEHYFRQLVCSFAALVTIRGSFVASMPICFACPSVRPSVLPSVPPTQQLAHAGAYCRLLPKWHTKSLPPHLTRLGSTHEWAR